MSRRIAGGLACVRGPSQLTAVGIEDDSADGYIEFGRLLRGRQSGADELLVLHAWP